MELKFETYDLSQQDIPDEEIIRLSMQNEVFNWQEGDDTSSVQFVIEEYHNAKKKYQGKACLVKNNEGRHIAVGVVTICDSEYGGGKIVNGRTLYVEQEYRRQGIGTKMMGLMDEYAASVNADNILIRTSATNEPALSLYKKIGFKEKTIILSRPCKTVSEKVSTRIDELFALEQGWLNGEGFAMEGDKEWMKKIISKIDGGPWIFPTFEGYIRLEWTFGRTEVSLDINGKCKVGALDYLNMETNDSGDEWYDLTDENVASINKKLDELASPMY